MTKVESQPDGLAPEGVSKRARKLLIALSWLPAVVAVAIASYFIFIFHHNEVELAKVNERLATAREQVKTAENQAQAAESQRARANKQAEKTRQTIAENTERIEVLEKTIATLTAREADLRKAAESHDPEVAIRKVRDQLANGTKGQRADLLFRNGSDAFDKGDLEAAERLFSEATKEDPTFAPGFTGLGRVAAERKDIATAERYYVMSVGVNPKYAHGWFNLAHLHYYKRKYSKAQDEIRRTLEIDPAYPGGADLRVRIEKKLSSGTQ